MSGRGARKRGRPPKTQTTERASKFNYQLLKKPKYLTKGSDSQFSTPSVSRASSPQGSDASRRSISRPSASKSNSARGRGRRGGASNSFNTSSSYARKGYESEYHYGSDFGDSTDKSDADDDLLQLSPSEDESVENENESDSDYSINSFGAAPNGVGRPPRPPSPDPVWLQDREVPTLELPPSSEDLLLSREYTLKAATVYEVLRRFRILVRLSPFRFEDFCGALVCEEQTPLLAEIHIMLLKAILREEDIQATHFGPLDQKDSVNITLYLMDNITWPEVMRSYIESDTILDRNVLDILSTREYPFSGVADRLTILQFLTDQFLITTSVRDDMLQEGPIHYDDHCRICHRLGKLLCCETCPAVFHLECVDPPLIDVPNEDWQCSICKAHKVIGVMDCISTHEKQGMLVRQDCLGYDRHGRKFWYVGRRVFVEDQDSKEIWYYSTVEQFNYLLSKLDDKDLEMSLCRELNDMRDEIYRQMRITERLTNENKGNKKSYFEIECERLEKLNGDNHTEERKSSRDSDLDMESGAENDVNKNAVERKSSTGSSDADLRMTRHKLNQLSSGTLYFKLGMENDFKAYVNQYTTNPIALNKPQRNEDRDKKRHLSHKFSLTTASEFKWTGLSNGTEANVVTTLRQTLLMLEQSIASSYMNPNWQTLRKSWVAAVTTCSKAADFVCVLIVLQACFKSVVFANVWHEQLGHIKLQRITSNEREEKKKLEKREKRERDDEEERNRLAFNYVKYSLGLKHQVWKQKGEEYRIHGQWGWIWMSYTRRSVRRGRVLDKITPSKIMMRVKKDDIERVISVDRKTELILKRLNENSKPQDLMTYSDFKEVEVLPVTQSFEQIDVSKALTTPGRLLYPKVARKSKLDDFLNRRIKLKEKEAEKFAASEKKEDDIDVVNDTTPTPHEPKQSASQTAAAAPPPPPPQPYLEKELMRLSSGTKVSPTSNINLELVNALAKKIQICRHQFGIHNRFAKPYRCYAKGCNTNSNSVSQINQATCYSPLCLQKARSKKELLFLLRKAHTAGNGSKETVAAILGAVKKPSILEQKLMEGKNNSNFNADDSEDGRNCDDTPVDVEQDFKNAMANSFGCEESLILSCVKLSKDEIKKESAFDIVKNETIKTEEIKTESENDNAMQIDNHEIESEVTVKTETDSSNGKRPCLEDGIIDVDSNPAPSVDVESSESMADFLDEDSSGKRSRKSSRRSTRSVNLDTSGQSKNGSKKDLTIEKQSVDVACINEKPIFVPKPNRRFPTGGKVMKKEEKCKFEKEMAPNGSERIYTAISPRGKVYLQQLKVESKQIAKLPPQKSYKFPIIANFNSHKAIKSIMMLPRFELLKLARHGGKMSVSGHHHLAKNNMSVWPYPCSRPLFKTCWLFRMSSLRTLSAVALQFRILWCCLRWDDMVTKPPTADGKHQITTETEIVTLELLKHRHVGKFSEKTQYLRRKVVIPLELPKTIREVTSIRSGLRKRKRAESPQQTEPQVTEEWVDEEKLELWEIKLFGEKQEKTVTRTVTGKLPPQRQQIDASSTSSGSHSHSNTKTIVVGPKATPEEIKEKMEHQLRLQRAAHNQKRQQQESKQGTTPKPNIIGNRRVIVKNPDGTTRIIHQTISAPTPKPSPAVVEQATTTQSSPAPQTPQHKVQIIRGPDGKVSVRGLNPGQQLIQMPDGKLHVLTTTPGAATKTVALKPTGTPTQTKTIVATAAKPQAVTPVANRQQVVVKQIVKPAEMKKIVTQKIVTGTQNQIVAQNVSQKAVQQVSSTTGQKIITSTGQIVSSSSGQKIITSTGNIQHLLVQACQKVVGSNVPVQKVLISPPQQQQQQQQQQQPVQQQIIVQNSPTAQPQQQFIINQQGQKVIQQLVTTGNQQQVIQRILLSPGQRLVTTQQPQTSQQVQVLQQHIIQPPQQQQQMVQPQVVVQQQQIQTQQVVQKVVQRQQPQLVQQQQQAAQQQQQQQQQAAQQQQQQQNQQQQQQQASNHQQVVVQNSALAQQLAQGKLQVAHVNGQQVIIRPLGNNQAQIVAHIKTQSDGSAHIVTNTNFTETEATPEVQSPQKVVVRQQQVQVSSPESVQQKIQQQPQQQQQQQQQHQQIQQQQIVQQSSGIAPAVEQSLLQGQPPGTVIKCVTAQVIQTDHGPRIVLQGLAGNDFTQHQLALVQQQVKQQLLKAQESSGKQGVLGPTKIYLAVQPSAAGQQTTQAQPPPLAPVQSSPQQQQVTSTTPMLSPTNKTDDVQKQKVNGAQLNPDVKKEILQKVLVANIQKKAALQQQQQQNQLHLQQTEDGININTENLTFATGKSDQSFVITPDYIQQTIKNALKQENLNPEIEEKLLNLQRYQERQMKSEVINNPTVTVQNHIAVAATSAPPSPIKSNSARKRPNNRTNDDDDWILETPRRRPPRVSTSSTSEKRFGGNEMHTMTGGSAISRLSFSEDGEDVAPPQPPPMNNRRLAAIKREGDKKKQNYQLTHRLYRHKELLKKDILKKRNLLEKELQIEIQKELATELSIRAKMERIKQEDYKNSENTPSHKKKSPSKQSTSHNAQETTTTPATNRTCATSSSNPGRNRKSSKSLGSSGSGSSRKKEKLYCICRTPYDDTKFYVGCDLCNNWFHGDCVNITEEASKKLSEFICDECKHARETQELYCLCKQPYDESQFYICCDKCQDWFHGRCVGILQSEAEYIDEYICPNCQRNNSVNFANMKNLSQTEYDNLKKLIKQIQGHKNAWPFMEPVDPEEAPDYYKVIKEPMDLKKVDTKITTKVYSKLSEFIGDMTKIFDNCRYYNPKESSFYKCAESLEGYFVQKIKHFRENLVDQS